MNKPKWGSSFYEGAAEAAKQEADEAAKLDFRGRAAQLAMAARDIAALESINAELARRAQKAERERDEARRQAAALTEGLRLVSDALARLDQIYRADTDLGDPPVETPAWLQEAQHRAAALLTPTAPDGGERVTMTIDVDALNAAPTVQCIRCNAPCSECATPTQKGAAK